MSYSAAAQAIIAKIQEYRQKQETQQQEGGATGMGTSWERSSPDEQGHSGIKDARTGTDIRQPEKIKQEESYRGSGSHPAAKGMKEAEKAREANIAQQAQHVAQLNAMAGARMAPRSNIVQNQSPIFKRRYGRYQR